MPLRPDVELTDFIEIFKRRKRLILFTFLSVMLGVILYCGIMPDIYRSSTTILIIPQSVPEKFVSSTVAYSVEQRLAATSRQILSRTRLIQVIDELGLYREERHSEPPEMLAEKMRKNIGLQIHGARGDKDSFVLSFEHEDPQMAMRTASRLSSFFIEENLNVREQLAAGTSEFLDTQVEDVKRRLEEQEEKVKEYKLTYMGELPQQMQANLNMLTRLQEQRRMNAEAIARAEDRKVLLETQISGNPEGEGEDPVDRLIGELYAKRKQLEDLSARYTSRYPTVVLLRREIEQLEENIAAVEKGGPAANDSGAGGSYLGRKAIRGRGGRLREQVRSLELEIQALKREQAEIQNASTAIQEKVGRLPQREQEMIALTRDYDNLRRSYDDLLNKRLSANVSQNLEARQKSEQFQVLDPPNLPTVPFKPDRKKVMLVGLFAALAFGFGGAVGLEMLDPTLRGMRDFKHYFDLPILASIPIIQDDRYKRRKALRRAVVYGGIVSFTGAYIVVLMMFGDKLRTIIPF